jgi:hypothetical protein
MAHVTIKAHDGMMLTDGNTVYVDMIDLAEGVDASAFYEITREEYEAITAEKAETD